MIPQGIDPLSESDSSEDRAFILLMSIFVGTLVISSVLASKIISIFGLFVPAGVLAYCVTFVVTDVISEIWGKERANRVVFSGFIALLVTFLLIRIALFWDAAPFWREQEAFSAVLGSTSRIIIASFIAYLASQYHDVWAFHIWKKVTGEKHLWLRNTASTIVSQFIDTLIFITIAFYGTMPVFPLVKGQYTIKVLIALLDTPFVYLVVTLIRRGCSTGEVLLRR
ncbi:MAG: queuosine precursor transporter [Proteobacteria bacterium]|nr:queuosine precursor transporter [Pseudomonadota bacterium]